MVELTSLQRKELMKFSHVNLFIEILAKDYPFLVGAVRRQIAEFGSPLISNFDAELFALFGSDIKKISDAVTGYAKFSLEAMKLQVKFQKTHQYESASYSKANNQVYQNRDYMFDLYLPGILISHYLWRHHYKQQIFFDELFLPEISENQALFFDVGVGTGFYSKRMLEKTTMSGVGFDMSPHSIEFTQAVLKSYGLNARYSTRLQDICKFKDKLQADVIINVEVLEHLEDPQGFLKCLVTMLKPGGHAFIAAAVNAPNEDHIYLYRSGDEVAKHIEESGLSIIHHSYDSAYDPRQNGELVPVNAVFIAKKGE
jgi:2-polyprenyl-3-methyl-5-hydroxy-6-metoxy-1,4-benzoquinol methylase